MRIAFARRSAATFCGGDNGDDWPKGAIAVTKNLDLLVEQDEPMAVGGAVA